MSQESDPPPKKFLSEYETSDEYCQAALKAIALLTKSSNSLPSDNSDTWNYYSTFKDFRLVMNTESSSIWHLIKDLLAFSSVNAPHAAPAKANQLVDLISEVNDHLLERVHSLLDEAEVDQKTISGSWNVPKKENSNEPVLITAKNIARPQLQFQSQIDNSNSPFIPKLKDKPNGIKPLSILLEYDERGEIEFYSHPYLFEIQHFKMYPSLLEHQDTTPIKPIEQTPLVWVSSPGDLDTMIQDLLKEKEIAVDLEAHNYRSFMGFTCLIQISTSSKDYLIDPFPIWSEMTCLNQVFTHPKILKIFHGADSDVIWLQRDFSLYLVNVFDTFRASVLLEFPKGSRSLKYLLSRYIGLNVDKQYQLADWRIRPLPSEMEKYAREDTHYLIFIYRKMKSDLLEKSNREKHLLVTAYDRSSDICKSRFEKPIFHETKHLDLLKKNRRSFNSKQLFALKDIYAWRHKLARREDESEHYILPNHMLLNICSELPREMQGILALCNPIPPHVKQNLVELHTIVYEARGKPLTFTSAIQEANVLTIQESEIIANNDVIQDPLKCPFGPFSKLLD
ncbi:RRP6 [Lepeophtheirus salmonis]|uniref:Exosome complex component 10 homolog n=1 Tax=Lepeophtheirus salmonis TaxID=72036 RepID=A0A7R8H1B0_LEPSM|nr:RRP6 [Lepeophtheirus salmonis]CAF2808092.1 RRP6 [Lepeophtheirus salmonis]